MSFLRIIVFALILIVGVAGTGLTLLHVTDDSPARAEPEDVSLEFDGVILAASDVDQYYAAYADGVLKQIPGAKDTVSLIDPGVRSDGPIATVQASHSVVGWPQIIATGPNGRFAYVVETRGKPAPDVETVEDVFTAFPRGGKLTVLDMSDRAAPRVADTRDLGDDLAAIAISPDGGHLAIAEIDELLIIDTTDGALGAVQRFPIETDPGRPYSTLGLRGVAWSPDGETIALNVTNRQIAFFRYKDGQLTPFGERLTIGDTLSTPEFHPSGDYLFTPDVAWGLQQATDYITNGPGAIHVIRVDPAGNHEVTASQEVHRSTEGFAISPDGTRIVAVNMNRTYLPQGGIFPLIPGHKTNSLSLVAFDAATGKTRLLDEQGFGGNLPEDAVFDADGDALAVAIFEDAKRDDARGYVAYWRIIDNKLIYSGVETPVARGPHDLAHIAPAR